MIYGDQMVNPARVNEMRRLLVLHTRFMRMVPLDAVFAGVIMLNVSYNGVMPALANTSGLTLPDPYRYAIATVIAAILVSIIFYVVCRNAVGRWWERKTSAPGLLRPVRAYLDESGPLPKGTTEDEVWEELWRYELEAGPLS